MYVFPNFSAFTNHVFHLRRAFIESSAGLIYMKQNRRAAEPRTGSEGLAKKHRGACLRAGRLYCGKRQHRPCRSGKVRRQQKHGAQRHHGAAARHQPGAVSRSPRAAGPQQGRAAHSRRPGHAEKIQGQRIKTGVGDSFSDSCTV